MSADPNYSFQQDIEIKSEEEYKKLMEMMNKSIFRPVDAAIYEKVQAIEKKINAQEQAKVKVPVHKKLHNWYVKTVLLPVHQNLTRAVVLSEYNDRNDIWTQNLRPWYAQVDNVLGKRERFNWIHNWFKGKVAYPMLRYISRKLSKHIVQCVEDIPTDWYNNHIRMFYTAFEQGLLDMWYYYKYDNQLAKAKYKTFKEFYDKELDGKNASHLSRMMLLNIAMTEPLEDTVDRTWFDCAMLRFCHYMMKHYGVSAEEMKKVPKVGEFPLYMTSIEFNPKYQFDNRDHKVWGGVKDDEVRLKCQRQRKKNLI